MGIAKTTCGLLRMALCIGAVLAAGCPPSPVEPPVPDAADAAPTPGSVAAACKNISGLGCPEGLPDADCVGRMQKAIDERLTKVDARCLARATSQDALRACGFVRCRR